MHGFPRGKVDPTQANRESIAAVQDRDFGIRAACMKRRNSFDFLKDVNV